MMGARILGPALEDALIATRREMKSAWKKGHQQKNHIPPP